MPSSRDAFAIANSAILVVRHQGRYVLVSERDARTGATLAQGMARPGEDIGACALRVAAEQLHVALRRDDIRYIGSVALQDLAGVHWRPVVLVRVPPEMSLAQAPGLLCCPDVMLDTLLASGGVSQTLSLAALALHGAKERAGLLR